MHMHAGYSPAEARKIARQIDARAEREARAAYADYRAEARACGYEACSFAEWRGETDAKAEASRRMAEIPSYMLDLY